MDTNRETLEGTEILAYDVTDEDLDNIKAGRKIFIAIEKGSKVIVMSQHPLRAGSFKPLREI